MLAPDSPWSQPTAELLSVLSTTQDGLSSKEAASRLASKGPNTLTDQTRHSHTFLFFRQFKNPIVLLLIISALLSFFLGEKTDASIILVIILTSAILGFFQENSAQNALRRLLQLVQIKTSVLRDGKPCLIPFSQTVPGDAVLLSAGNTVPGDCRLLSSKDLFTNEATLTGETFPVEKKCGDVPVTSSLSERTNTLFMGTSVISGTAKALIVRTGKDTEFGSISAHLRQLQPETEFERGIRKFGYLLLEVTLLLVLVIFCINVLIHKPALDSFLFSLAIAVGLTPQLLPAIISINLSRGAADMAKKSVIVKKLSAIENFGSMDILCSDKTGTITKGEIVLAKTLDFRGQEDERIFLLAYLNAFFENGYTNPIDQAILRHQQLSPVNIVKVDEVPYDFIRKRLSILVKGDLIHYLSASAGATTDNVHMLITKGAFDTILSCCTAAGFPGSVTTPIAAVRTGLQQQYERYSAQGYRILGVAWSNGPTGHQDLSKEDEKEMTFGGMLLLTDPPKEDIKDTITELNTLGIALKIITGDNALVARQVAGQIGLNEPRILTGGELRDMTTDALARVAPDIAIFAGVEPNQKEKILLALKKAGHVVGYMGDGINDAPALHAADVGISVSGAADVARQAADIVLMAGDLKVLADGVREGRRTFANTLKYIFMATSANFGNMFSMAGTSLFLSFLPLLPKQVLMTNLLTDIPEMTIASDTVDESMIDKPRRINLHFIRRFMVVFGLISSIFDYATFFILLRVLHADPPSFRTGWFLESVVSATIIILIVRTAQPFYRSRPGRYLMAATFFIVLLVLLIPYTQLSSLLGFTRLPARFYPWLILIILAYLITAETAKLFFYRKAKTTKVAAGMTKFIVDHEQGPERRPSRKLSLRKHFFHQQTKGGNYV